MTNSRPRVATTSPSQSPAPERWWRGERDRVEVEHQVREHGAEEAAADLGGDQRAGLAVADQPERALDQGDDRVERGRDRLQREDQRDQRGAGDEAVLEQLQPDVVGREPLGGDAGADDGGDQERGADELGERPPGELVGHAATPPISAPRLASASVRTR